MKGGRLEVGDLIMDVDGERQVVLQVGDIMLNGARHEDSIVTVNVGKRTSQGVGTGELDWWPCLEPDGRVNDWFRRHYRIARIRKGERDLFRKKVLEGNYEITKKIF